MVVYLPAAKAVLRIAVAQGVAHHPRPRVQQEQVVGGFGVLIDDTVVITVCAIVHAGEVHQSCGQNAVVGAEHLGGLLLGLCPVVVIQVDAGCQGVGGIDVEVILGANLQMLVGDVGQRSLNVGDNQFVAVADIAARIALSEVGAGVEHVGYAQVGLAGLLALEGLREGVEQHEVVVGTYEQCLGLVAFQRRCHTVGVALTGLLVLLGQFLDGLQGIVAREDAAVEHLPDVEGCVLPGGRDALLEAEYLVVAAVIAAQVIACSHLFGC